MEKLFLGLALAGIGIEVSGGDTRCVSCAEHLYNHYLDMTHHTFNGRPVSHGFQVAIGELTLCAFFDALLEMDLTKIDVEKCVEAWPTLEEEQARAKEIFKDFPVPTLGYEEITRKWQPKEEIRKQLEEEILETGKRTCIDLGIHGMYGLDGILSVLEDKILPQSAVL